jgi:uncharacterized protein (DUF1778 family)
MMYYIACNTCNKLSETMATRKSVNKRPIFSTRFKESQVLLVETAAEKLGLPRSTFLRKAAMLYAKKIVKDQPVKGLASAE